MAAIIRASSSATASTPSIGGSDPNDAYNQMTFAVQSSCQEFQPHPHKANMCINCMKLIGSHTRKSIVNPELVLAALEYSQHGAMTPSLILGGLPTLVIPTSRRTSDVPLARVYLGGYAGVSNTKWMIESKVSHVICCARGLSMFGKRYTGAITMAEARGVKFINFDWTDNATFSIVDELPHAVLSIANSRRTGTAVFIHCAQGKSRSTAALVAYIMASQQLDADAALGVVRAQRRMAEPNAGFMSQLKKWEKSASLSACRKQINDAIPTATPTSTPTQLSSTDAVAVTSTQSQSSSVQDQLSTSGPIPLAAVASA